MNVECWILQFPVCFLFLFIYLIEKARKWRERKWNLTLFLCFPVSFPKTEAYKKKSTSWLMLSKLVSFDENRFENQIFLTSVGRRNRAQTFCSRDGRRRVVNVLQFQCVKPGHPGKTQSCPSRNIRVFILSRSSKICCGQEFLGDLSRRRPF